MLPLAEYVDSISFRHFGPSDDIKDVNQNGHGQWMDLCQLCIEQTPMQLLRRLRRHAQFELENTVLPDDGPTLDNLKQILDFPRMSTLAMGAAINRAVALSQRGSCYLNVGVWHGFTFLAGVVGNPHTRCIGVDNFSEYAGPKDLFLRRFRKFASPIDEFYDMDFVDYLSEVHQGPIGVYMYDGGCTYERQLKALQLAEPHMADDCVILLDDANAEDTRQASMEIIAQGQHDYRLLNDIHTCHDQHPTFWNGLLVYQRQGGQS